MIKQYYLRLYVLFLIYYILYIKFSILHHTLYFWSQLCSELLPVDHFKWLSRLSKLWVLKRVHLVDHAKTSVLPTLPYNPT